MKGTGRSTLLVVEDDPDDRMLIQKAFSALGSQHDLRIVDDGEALLNYLQRQGAYAAHEHAPRPDLILLDLNMPRKSGHEALAEIKQLPDLRDIPVVVLTTSTAESDRSKSYLLGASGYLVKPVGFRSFVDLLGALIRDWLTVIERPFDIPGGRDGAVG